MTKGEEDMQKKLTVGELKASLKGVPEDLVVEFTSDTEESGDIILEYARRVKYELPVGQKFIIFLVAAMLFTGCGRPPEPDVFRDSIYWIQN